MLAGCGKSEKAAEARQSKEDVVHLVNGLTIPYSFLLNGEEYTLKPRERRPIYLEFGEVHVKPIAGRVPIGDFAFDFTPQLVNGVETDVLPVCVINPDTVAVLVKEQVTYDDGGSRLNQGVGVFIGQPVYGIEGVDFVFSPPPPRQAIQTGGDAGQKDSEKFALSFVSDMRPVEIFYKILNDVDRNSAANFLFNSLTLNPHENELLSLVSEHLSPEDAIGFLKSKLEVRPVLVEWHRAYQELVRNSADADGLLAEYKALLEKEPEDSALLYLTGRLSEDEETANALFKKSMEGELSIGYGHYAYAYSLLNHGRLSEALSHARNAVNKDSENKTFTRFFDLLQEATGDCERMIAELHDRLASDPLQYQTVERLVFLLSMTERSGQANDIIAHFISNLKESAEVQFGEGELSEIKGSLKSVQAEAMGDRALFIELNQGQSEVFRQFCVSVLKGDLKNASGLMNANENLDTVHHRMLLYVLAETGEEKEIAAAQMEKMLEYLKGGNQSALQFAGWLENNEPPPLEKVIRASWFLEEKRMMHLVIGARFPSARETYFSLAEKLNFKRNFTKIAIEPILAKY